MNAARRKELSRPTWIHPHPAAILLYSFRQVLLLSIPIVRAVVSLPFGGMDSWDDYLWVDLLAVCGMFALGFLRYLTTGIRIERQGIAYRSGLLVHRQGYIPFAQISVLVCEQKFWFRPIGYCTVYLDTDAGRAQSADFSLNLSKRRAEKLIGQVQSVCRNPDAVKRVCRASWWEVLFLSFISSDSLSGILFLSAAISGLGDFVSTDFQAIIRANFEQFIRLVNLLAIRIPPIAAWIAYILMITWGISFLVHVMRNLHFTVSRQDEELYVSSGVLSVYRHYIQTSKINRIEIRQTLLTKLIGVQSVFVQSCGYGKIKNSLSVLLPGRNGASCGGAVVDFVAGISFCRQSDYPEATVFGTNSRTTVLDGDRVYRWILVVNYGAAGLAGHAFIFGCGGAAADSVVFRGKACLLPAYRYCQNRGKSGVSV